jgi:hypothetical protein
MSFIPFVSGGVEGPWKHGGRLRLCPRNIQLYVVSSDLYDENEGTKKCERKLAPVQEKR